MITHLVDPGDRTRLIDNSTSNSSHGGKPPSICNRMPLQNSCIPGTVSAIILAGGKSSRMGTDKAELVFGTETLLERLVRVVDPLVCHSVVMLSEVQKLPAGGLADSPKISIGRDSQSEQGPLQGIADAIALVPPQTRFVLVLCCDLPFITAEWLNRMLAALSRSQDLSAVCIKQDIHLNPLLAVYRKSALMKASHYLKLGKRSCLVLLDYCKVATIEPPPSERYIISSINTPEEYHAALQQWQTMNS